MTIFNSYVSLPEGNHPLTSYLKVSKVPGFRPITIYPAEKIDGQPPFRPKRPSHLLILRYTTCWTMIGWVGDFLFPSGLSTMYCNIPCMYIYIYQYLYHMEETLRTGLFWGGHLSRSNTIGGWVLLGLVHQNMWFWVKIWKGHLRCPRLGKLKLFLT